MSAIDHSFVAARGAEIVGAAEAAGVTARMVGGAGIWAVLPASRRADYERIRPVPHDLDLLFPPKVGAAVEGVLGSLGLHADERLNAWRGDQRQHWFVPTGNGASLELDAFIGSPPLCHRIEFAARLGGAGPAMGATDLLLQKLQIVEINEKDLVDIAFLLLDREVAREAGPEAAVAVPLIVAELVGSWGLFHTATTNFELLLDAIPSFLADADAEAVRASVAVIGDSAEAAPKPLKWRMRARVGTKAPWYEEVEEVER